MTAYALRERAGKAGGGKGALIQTEKTGTVGTANDQVIIEIMNEKETIALAGNTIGRKPTKRREEKESLLDDGALSRKEGLSTRTVRDLRNDNEADGSASQEWRLAGQQTRESDASLQGMPQQNSSRPFCVRRLTPVEAERLQGFPDGYTKISYRGKSADECPDSPRYKAIGNSWAVPVVRWIGERIEKHLKGEIK